MTTNNRYIDFLFLIPSRFFFFSSPDWVSMLHRRPMLWLLPLNGLRSSTSQSTTNSRPRIARDFPLVRCHQLLIMGSTPCCWRPPWMRVVVLHRKPRRQCHECHRVGSISAATRERVPEKVIAAVTSNSRQEWTE